jgi:hypothetical protein
MTDQLIETTIADSGASREIGRARRRKEDAKLVTG